MEVEKIIYVTPGDGQTDRLGDLSQKAQTQLSNVISDVLNLDVENKPLAYRTTSLQDPSNDTLAYLGHNFRKANDAEGIFNNYVANPENIENVIASTKTAEVIVFGLSQTNLKKTLESLINTGYEILTAPKIQDPESIYVISVDVKNLKAMFEEFPPEEDVR